jgi:8-oxo-dGTP pyrophosphatase MutT (NUDIX family)
MEEILITRNNSTSSLHTLLNSLSDNSHFIDHFIIPHPPIHPPLPSTDNSFTHLPFQSYKNFLLSINIPFDKFCHPISKAVDKIAFAEFLEYTYWHYLDHFFPLSNIPKKNLKQFIYDLSIAHNFNISDISLLCKLYSKHKNNLPKAGCIIFNQFKHVALIKNFQSPSWSFPKGKPAKLVDGSYESLVQCAVREVFEETGLDVSPFIDPNLFIYHSSKRTTLFIIHLTLSNSPFYPTVSHEIEATSWVHSSAISKINLCSSFTVESFNKCLSLISKLTRFKSLFYLLTIYFRSLKKFNKI